MIIIKIKYILYTFLPHKVLWRLITGFYIDTFLTRYIVTSKVWNTIETKNSIIEYITETMKYLCTKQSCIKRIYKYMHLYNNKINIGILYH